MFYISIAKGLITAEHRKKMQVNQKTSCIWVYLWLLDKMTSIDRDTGLGLVLGRKPIKVEDDLKDFGDRKTVFTILKKLEQEGYIKTIRTPNGKSIFITKAKKIFGFKVKEESKESGTSLQESGTSQSDNLVLHNKESGTCNKTRQLQDSNTLPDKSGLSLKSKKMKPYKEPSIDLETGELEEETDNGGKVMKEIISWAEKRRGGKFLNYAKQMTALSKMKNGGYDPDEIKERYMELERDDFYKEKGLDFMSVVGSFSRKPLKNKNGN